MFNPGLPSCLAYQPVHKAELVNILNKKDLYTESNAGESSKCWNGITGKTRPFTKEIIDALYIRLGVDPQDLGPSKPDADTASTAGVSTRGLTAIGFPDPPKPGARPASLPSLKAPQPAAGVAAGSLKARQPLQGGAQAGSTLQPPKPLPTPSPPKPAALPSFQAPQPPPGVQPGAALQAPMPAPPLQFGMFPGQFSGYYGM
mmetsp:Transcript_23033/g.54580  ORF Transcript_23033/g.54580 Transcript_23033/m.54580 type:complete len:202 (-) Transcript_23033:292-897(-)